MDGKDTGRGLLTAAEIGALAHFYRGEVYRSTIWRTRLDNTTNWAVVTTGLALSLTYADEDASPLPLVVVALLVVVFLSLEARRYRYFNVWRARARLMETDFIAPMLRGGGPERDGRWNALLAEDLVTPRFHVSYARALGRRLRKNYCWILTIQLAAYAGKLAIHPEPLKNMHELYERAAVGPVPGETMIALGVLFHGCWIWFALITWVIEMNERRRRRTLITIA